MANLITNPAVLRFAIVVVWLLCLPGRAHAFTLYSFKHDNAQPIPYYINLGAYSTAANRDDLIHGIRNAFQHVQDNPFINVTFNYLGETTTLPGLDNVSVVYLDSDRTYVPGSGITLNFKTVGNTLASADIALYGPQYVSSPYLNLYAVTLHELCHFLGLQHSEAGKDSAVYANTVNQALSPDDVAGLATLYPDSANPLSAARGTVRGSITDSLGAPFRARMVAYDASKSQPRIVTVDAKTDGTYELPGLPPGTYNIFAETLATPFLHTYTTNGVAQVVSAGAVLQNRDITSIATGQSRLYSSSYIEEAQVHPVDGNIYATTYGSSATIRVINPSTGALITTLPFKTDDLAFTEDGKRLIIVSQIDRRLAIIDTEAGSPTKHTIVGEVSNILPQSVGVEVKGNSMAYVACNSGQAVLAIDLISLSVTATIAMNAYTQDIALSEDGLSAYVGTFSSGSVKWHEININPASPAYHTIIRSFAAGTNSAYMVRPDVAQTRVFICTKSGVDVRRRSDNALLAQIPGLLSLDCAVTPDGNYFAMLGKDAPDLANAQLLIVDTTTLSVVESVVIGGSVEYAQLSRVTGQIFVTGASGLYDVRPAFLAPDALASLSLSGGTLSPSFSRGTLAYASTVPHTTSSITITPAVAYAGATIKINGVAATSGALSANLPLNYGPNTIAVEVTPAGGSSTKTYSIVVNRDPPPEIAIERCVGLDIPDGGSADFGSVAVGSSSEVTFTIKNTGLGTLAGISLTKDGANANQFAITASPASSVAVAPDANTTNFTVRFTPTTTGSKTAVLHIANDDADENPFDITVTGEGGSAGTLEFDASVFVTDEASGLAEVSVRRAGGGVGSASATISTSNGTAVSPADFTAISGQVITFGDGDTTLKHATITINYTATAEPDETFTVNLSSPSGGATLGTQKTAAVKILDSVDTTNPATPVISSPIANAKLGVAPGGVLAITGTATDNQYVAGVEVSLDGGVTYNQATVTRTGAGASYGRSATFAMDVTPATGANTVIARTIDKKGNLSAPTARRSFTVLSRLDVAVNGPGTVTTGFSPNSYRELSKSYAIKAKPGKGQVFNGWSVNDATGTGITPAMQELPTLTFIHQEGLVLTANFILNPFTAGIIGRFDGLAEPSNAVPPSGTVGSNETVGGFTTTVMGEGSFTGTLKIDGLALPVKGTFDNTGVARFGATRATTAMLVRPGKPGLEVKLNLDMTGTTHLITGTVVQRGRSGIVAQSDIHANRAAYSTASKAPVALAGTTSRAWTMVFRHRGTLPGLASTDYPQGDGFATGTVKADGSVSFAGRLADHSAISASAALSDANVWPLYASLYGGRGSFACEVILTPTSSTDGELSGSMVTWYRPYQNVQWYPWGWAEGIDVEVFGASYQSPAQVLWAGLNATNNVYGNVAVTFKAGLLNASLNKTANFFSATAAKVPATDATWIFSLKPTSGAMSGTFTHTNKTKPAWQGVLIQRGANLGGYGYFMTVTPKVLDGTGESGRVEMTAK